MNPRLHNVADLERLEGLEQDNYWLRGRVQDLKAEVERLKRILNEPCPACGNVDFTPRVNPSSGHLGGAPPGVSPSPPRFSMSRHKQENCPKYGTDDWPCDYCARSDEPLPRRGSKEREDG